MAHISKHFESLAEFVDFAKNRDTDWRKQGSRDNDHAWAGGSFEEACDLSAYGWQEGRERMVRGLEAHKASQQAQTAPSVAYDVGGNRPDVPRYVAGAPDHMINDIHEETTTKPVIRLVMSRAASSDISTTALENWGIALMSHMDSLEEAGHQVELTLMFYNKGNPESMGHTSCFTCTIKQAGEHIEPDRLAFALAHPTMLRRLKFAVQEGFGPKDGLPDSWLQGFYNYGTPANPTPDSGMVEPGQVYIPGIERFKSKCFTVAGAVEAMGTLIEKALGTSHHLSQN